MHNLDQESSFIRRSISILALVVAGEAVFFLPFVLPRVFRPTLLDVFGLTNLELGIAFSVYGVVAMLAYFPGGPLADRYPARKLMAFALLATSMGGLVMTSIPSLAALNGLYGFWGVTTILLFWAPLIRATRAWGGAKLPGRAFGILDGGRGLVAAAIGSGAVALFAFFMPDEVQSASPEQRESAFRNVILLFSGITFAAAVFVWFALPQQSSTPREMPNRFEPKGLNRVIRMPTVWLQAIVVVCAYVGYKGLDDVSLYAHEVLEFDEVQSARVGTLSMWMRPFAAIAAGLLADRFGVARLTTLSLLMLALGSTMMAAGTFRPGMTAFFFVTLIATSSAVFALRGLYYAMMEEGRVPFGDTGSAVGIVSVVGYTPDIFMGPLMGILLDRWPGPLGHQYVFAVLAVFALVGLLASILFWRLVQRSIQEPIRPATSP
ncbi:Inner membrane protein YqcE [Rubripirellula lacrimiformis]|uniref:Inner membrane protein YqcE n=1 Tax=Rubripirellula lacrimiformis TaxID=1930273 RepID=A0A517NAD0_9BACT|nr:MFS transporter [Rubripirellula lacrimiformis]QDT04096.1 Inner membrane protein YqcE [Rubripirellula lacrimiformis]